VKLCLRISRILLLLLLLFGVQLEFSKGGHHFCKTRRGKKSLKIKKKLNPAQNTSFQSLKPGIVHAQ
jgi:hypothetical protein